MSHFLISCFIVSAAFAHTCAGQGSPMCEVNSEPRPCGKLCERTCEKPETVDCNPIDPDSCRNECRCVNDYVRNTATGHCVKVSECPNTQRRRRSTESEQCSENESLSLCGTLCEPTCANPKPNPEFCPRLQCTRFTEACRCDKGYLRDTETQKCVLQENCSPQSE